MLHYNKTTKSKPKREQTINESLTPNKTTEQSRTKGKPGFDSQNKTLCFQWLIKKFILGLALRFKIGLTVYIESDKKQTASNVVLQNVSASF